MKKSEVIVAVAAYLFLLGLGFLIYDIIHFFYSGNWEPFTVFDFLVKISKEWSEDFLRNNINASLFGNPIGAKNDLSAVKLWLVDMPISSIGFILCAFITLGFSKEKN